MPWCRPGWRCQSAPRPPPDDDATLFVHFWAAITGVCARALTNKCVNCRVRVLIPQWNESSLWILSMSLLTELFQLDEVRRGAALLVPLIHTHGSEVTLRSSCRVHTGPNILPYYIYPTLFSAIKNKYFSWSSVLNYSVASWPAELIGSFFTLWHVTCLYYWFMSFIGKFMVHKSAIYYKYALVSRKWPSDYLHEGTSLSLCLNV